MDLFVFFPIIILIILLIAGVPVGYTLLISGSFGIVMVLGINPSVPLLRNAFYQTVASYLFSTVPMFILMAEILSYSGLISNIYKAIERWTDQIPGGLAIGTTIGNGGMAALSGSSTASAATMASIAVPEMREYGYDDRLSMGTVSAAGSFAMMIPPSLALIIFGLLTGTSIAELFIAGIIPGTMTLVAYLLLIVGWVKFNPEIAGGRANSDLSYTWNERISSLRAVWPGLVLVVLVLGGLYGGFVTPTESGAFGAAGALLIAITVYGSRRDEISNALQQTAETTSIIFVILIGAFVFTNYLTVAGITDSLVNTTAGLPISNFGILLVILLIYFLLGTMMNQTAILVLTLPVTFPLVVETLGFDPLWFAVLIIKIGEIGMVTPPVGMNVYVAASTIEVDMEDVFAGAARFVIADLAVLLLLLLFPELVTMLPTTMS